MILAAPRAPVPTPVERVVHRAWRLHIDTGQEGVVFLHHESEVCRSEGFESETRVSVTIGDRSILATLNVVTGPLLGITDAGLSERAWIQLGAVDGATVTFAHPLPLESLRHVRAKIHGRRLDAAAGPSCCASAGWPPTSGSLGGWMRPVRDPESGCWVDTWFEGRLVGDTLSGTYFSRRDTGETVRTGTWWAARQ